MEVIRDYKAPPPGSPSGTLGTSTYTVTVSDETRAAGFAYTLATKSYTVRWFGFEKTYGPSNDFLFQNLIPTSQADDFTRSHFWAAETVLDYTKYSGFINWQVYQGNGNAAVDSVTKTYASLFGAKTTPSDQPTTGTLSFKFSPAISSVEPPMVGLDQVYVVKQGAWNLQVNWATRAVTGTLRLDPSPSAPAGTLPLAIDISGNVVSGNNRVEGTFSGSGATGTFIGATFGPRGRELGFAYRINLNGKTAYAGVVGGSGS